MADIDDKTQKLIDKNVKTARKDLLKQVNDAIADAVTANKDEENKDVKKGVASVLKDLKVSIKDATAE